MNNQAVFAKHTGMIILGGGLAKHHICNANMMVCTPHTYMYYTVLYACVLCIVDEVWWYLSYMGYFMRTSLTRPNIPIFLFPEHFTTEFQSFLTLCMFYILFSMMRCMFGCLIVQYSIML